MARKICVTLLLVCSCKKPGKTHWDRADAAPQLIEVTLGAPISAMKGDVWPNGGSSHQPLSMHAVEGPVYVTVHFPSGRVYAGAADDVTFTLDEAKGTIKSVAYSTRKRHTWAEAKAESFRMAKELGVPDALLREERWGPERSGTWYPSYPVEGCIVATTGLYEVRKKQWSMALDIGITTPSVWSVFEDWPKTCGADGG